jgi:hypothetical protein
MFKDWPPPNRLPVGVIDLTDSGFQGLRTDYPPCSVIQPQKKPRGQELNQSDRPWLFSCRWGDFVVNPKEKTPWTLHKSMGHNLD